MLKKEVDDEAYALAWLNLSNATEVLSASKVEAALEKIFPPLLKVSKSNNKPKWLDDFVRHVKVWTQKDVFISPSEVYIPDDGVMQKILGKVGVEYAWRPRSDSFADYEPLYKAIGVNSLASSTTISYQEEGDLNNDEWDEPNYLTPSVKIAICWYLRNSSQTKEFYTQLKKVES